MFSSSLRRCTDTLALACPGTVAHPDARLRELNFGAWEGRTYAECLSTHPDLLAAWTADPAAHAPPGGECLSTLAARVGAFAADLPTEGAVLVVAHGGSIRCLLARMLELRWEQVMRMRVSACGLTRLAVYPEGAHLLCLNDTAHLAEADL